MQQQIRLPIMLSVTVLVLSACSHRPPGYQSTPSSTYSSNSTTTTPRVPEAGPLTESNTTTVATNTHQTPVNPAGTTTSIPQAGTHTAATTQTPASVPQAHNSQTQVNTDSSPYSSYAADANGAAGPVGGVYDYSGTSGNIATNNSYTHYGTGNVADNTNNYAANTAVTNSGNGSYDSYTSGASTGTPYAAGTANTYAASGGAAIQVFATVSRPKAERIRQEVSSMGLNAVVDNVDGLYKVRVPYPDETTARANLSRVRNASGEFGAFVTRR